jgi:nicotinic acid mononucleotide adenylyltransferase/nicotinamide mononucleotide (NMN) deamidase PncC
MIGIDPGRLISTLDQAGVQLVLVSAGGGSAAVPHLLSTPGASSVVLEAVVPYARAAVDDLLGGRQETYCGSRTARRLAMAAWQRARGLQEAAGVSARDAAGAAVGAAVTASLRTRAPKRGPHRVCAAVQTLAATRVVEVVLEKEARSRADEEELAAAILLDVLGGGHGLPESARLRPRETPLRRDVVAPAAWRDLLAGDRSAVLFPGGDADAVPGTGGLLFPGSFDPLHEGHLLMARLAEEIAERPLAFELSIANVDKPTLDYVEISDRAGQFAGRPLWLTRAATFVEKLDLFPSSTFVLGADTFARLPEPRYYGGSADAAAAAVERIATGARGLIVFGRCRDGTFQEAAQIPVPHVLRDVSYFVSQREFRLDVSSTDLRRRALEAAGQEG